MAIEKRNTVFVKDIQPKPYLLEDTIIIRTNDNFGDSVAIEIPVGGEEKFVEELRQIFYTLQQRRQSYVKKGFEETPETVYAIEIEEQMPAGSRVTCAGIPYEVIDVTYVHPGQFNDQDVFLCKRVPDGTERRFTVNLRSIFLRKNLRKF